MKRAFVILACLFAMLSAGTSLRAQEIVISLHPGWNRIGYPFPEPVSLDSVFDPVNEDIIESEYGVSVFDEDQWWGEFYSLEPGSGYLYYSNRSETISLVLRAPSSSSVTVTTSEPTNINYYSAICGGTVTVADGDHVFMRGVCWGTEPNPTVDDNHTTDEAGIGSWTVQVYGLAMGTTYHVRAYAVTDSGLKYGEDFSFTTEIITAGEHDYVDLGLPSGIMWATCNVGASTPEEYGDYFAWGETQTKDVYSWSTYQYCNGDYDQLTKYCSNSDYGYEGFIDTLTVLLPEDDAVTANWGADWRMPTIEEWEELYQNTTMTWTTQNDVNGMLFTASNGNSLFLPAAGDRDYNSLYSDGYLGIYWSSTLNTGSPSVAWRFFFDPDDYGRVTNLNRYFGLSVRAVRSGQNVQSYTISVSVNPSEGGSVSGDGTYEQGQNCTLTATPNEGFVFTNWTENGEVVSTDASYTFTVQADRTLVANFTALSGEDHAYVDLGLPSGTLWATCNVGASAPEEYGDYFAWGETQLKIVYNWSTYQYCNGDYNTLTKYCNDADYGYNGFTDNLTTLLPEDDAAAANWGSDWRMPTKEEYEELYSNTTCTWTTQNGVNGRLFTASNGNSLFLPAAGLRLEDGSIAMGGNYGNYWSSSLNMDTPNRAWDFTFYSEEYDIYGITRDSGRSVRPVRPGQNVQSYTINVSVNPTEGGIVSGDGTYERGQSCTLTATPSEGYVFTKWTENGEVVSTDASYIFTVQADRTLVANFTASSGEDHAYVDLGLPSGTLWATCNVGASAPEEYGDYFAWGETQLKIVYNWSTYQYCNGDYNTLTKYCNDADYGYNGFTDNLTTLLPEDDAAAANWGSDWRMPTKEEYEELYSNTTCTWTTQNGVNGRLFTASNGNSLFLPAAGLRLEDGSIAMGGIYGNYWSSSLNMDTPNRAWDFTFYSEEYDIYGITRDSGRSVRPVRSGQN